jgi:hypothetical protein
VLAIGLCKIMNGYCFGHFGLFVNLLNQVSSAVFVNYMISDTYPKVIGCFPFL